MSDVITYSVCANCSGLNRMAFDFPLGKSPVCGKCKSLLVIHDGVSSLNVSSLEILSSKSPLPVVIDFWAPWCSPCRAFSPTFIAGAERLKGRVVFGKIDTEANPNAGQKFGVRGIPTLIMFLHGKEAGRISGALSMDEFIKWVLQTAGELQSTHY